MRLIDKDRLISILNAKADMACGDPKTYFLHVAKMVELLPDVDAVEVVRCKDCNWNDGDGYCLNPKCGKSWYGCPVKDNHFCSYGERKGDE